jgi:hypothetical protein
VEDQRVPPDDDGQADRAKTQYIVGLEPEAQQNMCRVTRFFLVQHTKTWKRYTKLPQNIPNVHKLYQMKNSSLALSYCLASL